MSYLRSKPLTERLICACENHPWLINISATMRVGVSHVHRHGNELTLLSEICLSFSCCGTRKHSGTPGFKTNIPLIRPINQSINHAALTCITCTRSSLSSVGAMIEIYFHDSQRRTKIMSNFSILNHTCKVASNFMPCLFLQPTSRRVNLINHHNYTCSHVLLTTNNKPINQLSDLTVVM